MPGLRTRAVGTAARLAGLPWRVTRGNRGKPLSPDDPRLRRMLVIKPCCMGDVLMTTAAITALREALPDTQIDMAVGPWSRPAVANNPWLNNLVDFPEAILKNIGSYMSMVRQIRRGRYGTALVLDRSPLLNLLPALADIPIRAGLDSDGRGIGLTHPVPCPSDSVRHEVEWYLDVVRTLGLPARRQVALEFYPTDSEKERASLLLSEAIGEEGESESGCVAIHVGGGSNPDMKLLSKRWKPQNWARIADWLAETYEPTILLLGGPNKEDRQAAEEVKSALFSATQPYVIDMVGKLEWGEMAAVIDRCNLFLGNDTGAMHLATAVGTPVVALFGPSGPARYGPWDPSGRSRVVAGKSKGMGAEALRDAARGKGEYHNAVSPEEVWEAVEKSYAMVMAEGRKQA
ncbi:MAG: glycosyltransferase family 9 protein [Chloroflexia bacterium]